MWFFSKNERKISLNEHSDDGDDFKSYFMKKNSTKVRQINNGKIK